MAFAKVLHISHASTIDGREWLVMIGAPRVRSLLQRIDTKRISIVQWYRVLRVQHEWTLFQAIRFALWLAR